MWPFPKKPPSDDDASRLPDIILAGLGVRDRAELTVELQRVLTRYGRTFAIGLTPTLRSLLTSMRVQVTELDERFSTGRPFAEVYADIVQTVIQRASIEKPVILLTRGNPMFMNTVSRTLVIEGRRLGLAVQVMPGISLIDTLVSDIGIDVGVYGLQVFDAHWLVGRALPMSDKVPALILNLQGFGLDNVTAEDTPRDYAPLLDHLARYYDGAHTVTLIRTGASGGLGFERCALADLGDTQAILPQLTCLFLDAAAERPSSDAK